MCTPLYMLPGYGFQNKGLWSFGPIGPTLNYIQFCKGKFMISVSMFVTNVPTMQCSLVILFLRVRHQTTCCFLCRTSVALRIKVFSSCKQRMWLSSCSSACFRSAMILSLSACHPPVEQRGRSCTPQMPFYLLLFIPVSLCRKRLVCKGSYFRN